MENNNYNNKIDKLATHLRGIAKDKDIKIISAAAGTSSCLKCNSSDIVVRLFDGDSKPYCNDCGEVYRGDTQHYKIKSSIDDLVKGGFKKEHLYVFLATTKRKKPYNLDNISMGDVKKQTTPDDGKKIPVSDADLSKLQEICLEVYGKTLTNDELHYELRGMPEYLLSNILKWGINDTCVGDDVMSFIEKRHEFLNKILDNYFVVPK